MNQRADDEGPAQTLAAVPSLAVIEHAGPRPSDTEPRSAGVARGGDRLSVIADREDETEFGPVQSPATDDGRAVAPFSQEEVEAAIAGTPDGMLDATAPADATPRSVDDAMPEGDPTSALGEGDAKEPRRRRRARLVEDAGEEEDAVARLTPMIRHLAALTKDLSEAQRTVGTLTAERDLLRRQLTERPAAVLPVEDGETAAARPGKEARIEAKLEAKAAKQAERVIGIVDTEPVPTPEDLVTRAQEAGRRRRLIALGLIGALAAVFLIGRAMEVDVGQYISKDGVTGIPYFGLVFQLLIVGFMMFRIVRVGGKARDWLFPAPEEPKRRRR